MLNIDVSAPFTRTFTLLFGNLTTTKILSHTIKFKENIEPDYNNKLVSKYTQEKVRRYKIHSLELILMAPTILLERT
jgi:hypothetical protein